VPRVDNDKGLADLVDISASPKLNPAPPAHRTTITQPTPPQRHPSQRQLRSRRSPCPFRSARSCCGTGPTCPHQTMCPSPLTPAATQAERRSGSARSPHRRGWSHKQLNTRRHGHGAHRSTGPEKPGIPGRIQLPSPTGCRLLSFRKKASLGAASATSLAASSPR
jgi:hypothetical protein